MYSFEWNDRHNYKTREDLCDELRNIADYIESGGSTIPSQFYNSPAGWLYRNGTCREDFSDMDMDDEDDECTNLYDEEYDD